MTEPTKAKLYSALVRAQREARAVFRDAENKHQGFRYASAEQLIDEARKALGAAGLAVFQADAGFAPAERRLQVGKSGELIGRAIATYRLVHESGEFEDYPSSLPVVVTPGRPDDKAELSALTQCLAYFLRGLLLIPRDDAAASIDSRDDRDFDPRSSDRREEPAPRKADEPKREPAKAADAPLRDSPERKSDDAPKSGSALPEPPRDADPEWAPHAREFVRSAYAAADPAALAELAAEVKRSPLPADLREWTLGELRRAWTERRAAA